jgi:predicted nuclease of predicted toxin-antitoxin system
VSVRLYTDVHVHRAITEGLRLRGVDVLTAQEDGARRLPDGELLNRATALGRVLFTQDVDLLREAAQRQRRGGPVLWCCLCPSTEARFSHDDC